MSANLNDVDVSDAKELGDFTPFPNGEYVLYIDESERKPTKSGDGEYLSITVKVKGGEHDGRTLYHNFNLWNKSQQAKDIARSEFRALCEATVGEPNAPGGNSEALHYKPFIGDVEIEIGTDGKARNHLKFSKGKIRSVNGSAPVQNTASAPSVSPPVKSTAGKPAWAK